MRKVCSLILDAVKYMPRAITLRRALLKSVLENCGDDVNVTDAVTFLNPQLISIGHNVSVHEYTTIGGKGFVIIGSFVSIASHCRIVSDAHNIHPSNMFIKSLGCQPLTTIIEDDVWLGSGATILGGVKIGRGSVIGAGSVVTKDIPEYSVAVGVPCKVIRRRKCQ